MRTAALPLLVLAAACGSGGGAPAPVGPAPTQLRIASDRTGGGAGNALAAELLLASGAAAPNAARPVAAQPLPAPLANDLRARALDHLRSEGTGAAQGPSLAGSARVRRLAAETTAPRDTEGDGENLDETLQAERVRIALEAGASDSGLGFHPLFPWRDGGAQPKERLGAGSEAEPGAWRCPDTGERTVELAQLGDFLHARALAAGALLRTSRGAYAGADASTGVLGLTLLHQVLAAEETAFVSLFGAGGPLGELRDPAQYDPANGASWLPATFFVDVEPQGELVPLRYRARDGASDLEGLASVLLAAAELQWLAADANPHPALRDLFRGHPFGSAGGPRPPRGLNPGLADSGTGGGADGLELSWSRDVGPLLAFRCGGCHLGFPTGGFLIDTLQDCANGSARTRAAGLTMIVPGEHAQSFLHRVLLPDPPPPFRRMPDGSPMSPAEIQIIADWIDQGAREHPSTVTPPPPPGALLARVSFANLVALHRDGALLHHRFEGTERSGIVTAVATGRALQALAALHALQPLLEHAGVRPGDLLRDVARDAAVRLVPPDGIVAVDAPANAATTPFALRAELRAQAELAAGLALAAAAFPAELDIHGAARRAIAALLWDFADPATGLFVDRPGAAAGKLDPSAIAAVSRALRAGAAIQAPGCAEAHASFFARLSPVLAYAEWSGSGEEPDDGVADTDGDGVPEPAAVNRLPLLAGEVRFGADASLPPADAPIGWSTHVLPLFESKCAECHLHGTALGNYRLDSLALLRTPGDSNGAFPLLVPGDPDASLLFTKLALRRPPLGAQMPERRPPLDAKGIETVRRWILEGALGR